MAGRRGLALTAPDPAGPAVVVAPAPQDSAGAQVRTGVVCLMAVAACGLPVGLLWSLLAPRPDVLPVAGGGLQYADTESKDFIAGDATLFLLCLAAGLVTGVLVWRRARSRPLGALLGLVLGAGLAAWLASRVGVLGEDREAVAAAARAGRLTGVTDLPLQLRARSVLFAWPALAALTWTVLSLRHPDPALAPQPAVGHDPALAPGSTVTSPADDRAALDDGPALGDRPAQGDAGR